MILTQRALDVRLREPFASNTGTLTAVRQIVVELRWGSRTGLGTAVVAKGCERLGAALASRLDACAGMLADASPFDLEVVRERIEAACPGQPAALSALDMALHDLLGKVRRLPLRDMLGLANSPLGPTAVSLGAGPPAAVVERARRLADWPILKLKLTAQADLRVVGRVREVYGGRIWVDGNGSWSPAQALAAAETLHRHGVEFIEQPIRAGHAEQLRFVHERSPVPIVADEDCAEPADIARLAGCVAAVNLKLLTCGGLRRALEMIQLARRAGLGVMLGCKTESALGVTAMAQLGGLADHLDLDGHLDLLDDPYVGIVVERGRIALPGGPGLGVTPHPNAGARRALGPFPTRLECSADAALCRSR